MAISCTEVAPSSGLSGYHPTPTLSQEFEGPPIAALTGSMLLWQSGVPRRADHQLVLYTL